MPYLSFLKKQQNLKSSSAALYGLFLDILRLSSFTVLQVICFMPCLNEIF